MKKTKEIKQVRLYPRITAQYGRIFQFRDFILYHFHSQQSDPLNAFVKDNKRINSKVPEK